MMTNERSKNPLPLPWEQLQGAVWVLGIAILAWQGWWWPGIMVLVGISMLVQGYAEIMQRREKDARKAAEQTEKRTIALPDTCPNCGSPVDSTDVTWKGDKMAACSFCGGSLTSAEKSA